MTEAERVQLYNDLCDLKSDMQEISYPPQTRQVDILSRAISFVKGVHAKWLKQPNSINTYSNDHLLYYSPTTCSSCHFAQGRSDFRICPNCGARMQR